MKSMRFNARGRPPTRVLLTGLSGAGKSTVLSRLAELGYRTIDADLIFISGTCRNQVAFYPQFDHIVLLSAPVPLLIERLTTRSNNPYGKREGELAETLRFVETVEPTLRAAATLEIDTSAPLDEVVRVILAHVSQ